MALSIKTEEADRLARSCPVSPAKPWAVTLAMRERLERLRAKQEARGGYVAHAHGFVRKDPQLFDRRPVTK